MLRKSFSLFAFLLSALTFTTLQQSCRADAIQVIATGGISTLESGGCRISLSGVGAQSGLSSYAAGPVSVAGTKVYFVGTISKIWFPTPTDHHTVVVESDGKYYPTFPATGVPYKAHAQFLLQRSATSFASFSGLTIKWIDEGDSGIVGSKVLFTTGVDPLLAGLPKRIPNAFGTTTIWYYK